MSDSAAASPPLPTARQMWLVVGLLWFVGCLNYLDRVMLITMRLSIKEAIPMTDTQFGLLTTTFLIVYGVLSGFGGYLSDRISCSRVIIGSLFTWSLTTWLTAHATTFHELLLTRAIMGISEAAYLPAAVALIASYHGNATRSLANGIHLSGVMVGSGLGGLGGFLAERHDWTYVFNLFGLIGVAYSVVLLLFLRDPPVSAARPVADPALPPASMLNAVRSLFAQRDFGFALLFWALLGVTSWAFTGWLPTYLIEHFQLPQGEAGLLATGVVYAGALVGTIASGAWADRWSKRHPRGRIWVSVIGLGVCIPCVLLVATSPVLAVAVGALFVYGVSRVFPDTNMMPILFQFIDRRYRATGYGLLNAAGVFSGGLTIYIGGWLRDSHVAIQNVFLCGTVGLGLCAVLLWRMRPAAQATGEAGKS